MSIDNYKKTMILLERTGHTMNNKQHKVKNLLITVWL